MGNKIELLAPAGNGEALRAAVENGADAVYLGGRLFNARRQADNFDMDALKEVLDYSHVRGVNIYLTLNTLVSDDEMRQALEFAAEAREAGIDGIIVQDLGLAAALRRVMPDVPLHGSTQMTIYDAEGVKALEAMGFKRVVLARELTLGEISEIARDTPLEIEVFVHGALCVCYSGQCLMSGIIGGRSGNRGMCAQPCRLPYRLIKGADPGRIHQQKHIGNGEKCGCDIPKSRFTDREWNREKNKGDRSYLLSPKDICTLDFLDEIVSSGVSSLKIEGRMKSPEYVATVVRIYRKYLDMALETGRRAGPEIESGDMRDLLQVYNRGGFSAGYFKGKTGADMMSYEKPNNSGIYLGSVMAYDRRTRAVSFRPEGKVSLGDGVEIWAGESGGGADDSAGGIVTSISKLCRETRQFKRDTASPGEKRGFTPATSANKGEIVEIGDFSGRIVPGMKIYKTLDKELNKAARESYARGNAKRVAVSGHAALKAGRPLEFIISDDDGNTVTARSCIIPEPAIRRPLTEERLKEQLEKTGATPAYFSQMSAELEEDLSIPICEINEVRRQALDSLLKLRANKYEGKRADDGIYARIDEAAREAENPGSIAEATREAENSGCIKEATLQPEISLYFYQWDDDTDYERLGADRLYLPLSSINRPGFAQRARSIREAGTEVFIWLPAITRGNYNKLIVRLEKESGSIEGEPWHEPKQPEPGLKSETGKETSNKSDIDGILISNIGTACRFGSAGTAFGYGRGYDRCGDQHNDGGGNRCKTQCRYHGDRPVSGELRLAGDISLNLYNSLSIREAVSMGLESVAVSAELSLRQIKSLAITGADASGNCRKPAIETAVYGRLPLMTSEYCPVGCAKGGFRTGAPCGGGCVNGNYSLEDRLGKQFPVLCDRGDCRSTILNSSVLFVPESLPALKDAGVSLFRLYIWDEGQENIRELVKLYKAAAAGGMQETGKYERTIKQIRAAGFTKGHYYKEV